MAGQPTKYNKDMQAKAELYLEGVEREWVDKHDIPQRSVKYGSAQNVIPSAEGLAIELKVSTKTLYNWGERHSVFLHTLEAIQEKQKNVTLNSGLTGVFNATIAKLVLANHGMHDKQDTAHSGEVKQKVDININARSSKD